MQIQTLPAPGQAAATADVIALEDSVLLPTYKKLPIVFERGNGPYIWDADGNRYIDFYGGHCVTPLGHCHPRVVESIKRQAETLMFYSNIAYNSTRANAARLLAEAMPAGFGEVFFCNSGSEANETALKIARKKTGRWGVVALRGAFHGRTLGSLAATWSSAYREPYKHVLPETFFVEPENFGAVSALFGTSSQIAAVIVEPIQSMAGVRSLSTEYLSHVRELCESHGALLIFDEVQTGVGRTGTFSISERLGVEPHLITMAKSLGSGVPVGAVWAAPSVGNSVGVGDQGTTFGGGMLAMAAVHATVETILSEGLMDRASLIFDRIAAATQPHGLAARGAGCLIGLDAGRPVGPLVALLRNNGVLVGGSSDPNVMRLMPPLNTEDSVIDDFADALARSCSEWATTA